MCVCGSVSECEHERERACVCVCVCVRACTCFVCISLEALKFSGWFIFLKHIWYLLKILVLTNS